ncbi:MAG: TetR/AcrR family transcriptional regulator [Anaerolineae bacterium]
MPRRSNDALQEQLAEARRHQILDAAVTVFAEKGFARATIKDVAHAAGIADGTIYIYFENKTALLLGILNRLNESDQRPEHFEQGGDLDIETFVRVYLRRRFKVMSDSSAVFQIVLSEVLVNKDLRELYMTQVIAPTFAVAEPFFRQLVEEGKVRPHDPALSLRAISSMALGLLLLRIMGDPYLEQSWDDIPDLLTNFILHGLGIEEIS